MQLLKLSSLRRVDPLSNGSFFILSCSNNTDGIFGITGPENDKQSQTMWAMSQENLSSRFCDQVRLEPVCSATEAS